MRHQRREAPPAWQLRPGHQRREGAGRRRHAQSAILAIHTGGGPSVELERTGRAATRWCPSERAQYFYGMQVGFSDRNNQFRGTAMTATTTMQRKS
jgi:hypothetical protein